MGLGVIPRGFMFIKLSEKMAIKQNECWIRLNEKGKIVELGARCKKKEFKKTMDKLRGFLNQ